MGGRPWPGAKKDGISKKGEGIPVQEGEVDDQMLQVGDEYQQEVHPRGRVETNRLQLHHVLIWGWESAAQRARRSSVVVENVSS